MGPPLVRSFWGWGEDAKALDRSERDAVHALVAARVGRSEVEPVAPPRLDEIRVPAPRVEVPPVLREFVSQGRRERAAHTYGKAFRDVVRAVTLDFQPAPDAVAFPRTEAELAAVLEWCAALKLAVVPYGGGTSVVGGVEARVSGRWNGAVSVDLRRLAAILEVDPTSRAARIQAGIEGPALEDGLAPHGLTLRHFPQSFEFSTLGGWIATRAGGHYATLHTRIDDFVEGLRVVTPAGTLETRRCPSSGAGPAPDRLFIGSEGTLGIITEAWMRLQDRPTHRAGTTVRFESFEAGADAVRLLAQAGLYPSNCRLVDAREAQSSGLSDGAAHVLLVGFESAEDPVDAEMRRALEICAASGGSVPADEARSPAHGERGRELEAWRAQFLRAPYVRDALVLLGYVVETFESAITWDRFGELHRAVTAAVEDALRRVCGGGVVTCRLTHAYADGAAPYFTVIAPARAGSRLDQWDEIKAAASEAILAHGGTITHHHAVGRDHRRWYERERPSLFGDVLRAAKSALDPSGMLNPGVLIGE